MKRSLFTLVLLAASAGIAASAHAQIAVVGGATPQRPAPAQADPLGPRSTNFNATEALARAQIEHGGYSGVRGLMHKSDGGWQAVAVDRSNTKVVVALDRAGKVSELR
jgi:hypothetical protein